ncbi:MAG: phosphonate ABC transporter, permease protein PhnE [Anaerolineales bacterium]|nr:phosphonate ABC transporter, permease protein PhnE [Anaerolineales bacterium]
MRKKSAFIRWLYWMGLAAALVLAYIFSIRVTKPDFVKLVVASPKAGQILSQLMTPDLFTQEAITSTISLAFPVPCGSATETPAAVGGAILHAEPGCASEKETFELRGEGMKPNAEVKLSWRLPNGQTLGIKRIVTDESGAFTLEVQARPIITTQDGVPAQIEAETQIPSGRLRVSQTLKDVVDAMFVTIFMALLATTFGTIVAAPLSFLAAANITRRGKLGTAVYYVTRSFLNLIRAYEPLVMATIFALIVGFGNPFAGVLALVFVTMASLGKMFSESVESIDPGSIEAVTATGGNRPQVVFYAVVPQIIPDFLSFIIYHWDINVRISTIIGFVGGGGIGFYLSQRINSFEYHKAGTALLAIIIVVWALDFFSAEVRKRLT